MRGLLKDDMSYALAIVFLMALAACGALTWSEILS